MSQFRIDLDEREHEGFLPGETVSGRAAWSLDVDEGEPASAELRLFWYTNGKGTEDVGVVETLTFDRPQRSEQRPFRLALPLEPYSFSGTLISLIWALELVVSTGPRAGEDGEAECREIVMSPTRREILLTR
jgi:hypothetical protein